MEQTEALKMLKENNANGAYEKEIWIWGTGNTAEMFQEGLNRWKRYNQIYGYIDNNPEKWGKLFYGKPVISPDQLRKRKDTIVLLCSNQLTVMEAVGRQLNQMGLAWGLLESFVLKDLREEVSRTYSLFEEEHSKILYEYLISCKMKGCYPKEDCGMLDSGPVYFSLPEFRNPDPDEIFVDVGCFTGDTIEEYLSLRGNLFRQIYSFEPDTISYSKAKVNVNTLCEQYNLAADQIRLYPYGVGSHSGEGAFEHFEETEGAGSKFVSGGSSGENAIKIVSLDDFLPDGFSFLKADVESYEYQVLLGAEKSIRKHRPKLAICIYHNTFDFIQIPSLLKRMVPEYRLFIRQYAASWSETVLYATV